MPRERVSFAERANPAVLTELMDEACSYEEFRACLLDLAQVNRMTLAYRPTMSWLAANFARPRSSRPLRIVDVGCGGGDMLRRVALWAEANNVPVALTGVDLNPHAIRAAQEFTPRELSIEYVCGDAFGYKPAGGIDVVLSSLMTHHLATKEIVAFLAWMDRSAQCGWFVNDLARGPKAFYLFGALARLMRWHPFVRHDGPVSIRRGFRAEDWEQMLRDARIAEAKVEGRFPGRLCVSKVML